MRKNSLLEKSADGAVPDYLRCGVLGAVVVLIHTLVVGQGGTWTWIGGQSGPATYTMTMGPQGVYGPGYWPPPVGSAQSWTGLDGTFWFFGGGTQGGGRHCGLWKYDATLGQWAWVDGVDAEPYGVMGTQGVASAANQPQGKRLGAAWTGNDGTLWMFGGSDGYIPGITNNVWRYQPATNQWTWMKGSNQTDFMDPGSWGTVGVSAASNRPSPRNAVTTRWVDDNGDFWFFGGYVGNIWGDMWRYSVADNNWTWMSGSSAPFAPAVYGTQGVGSTANRPKARHMASSWKTADGKFWLYGGCSGSGTSDWNDMWSFDPVTLEWTWWSGTTTADDVGDYPAACSASATSTPTARWAATQWVDQDNNLWLFGGVGSENPTEAYSDLWKYCTATHTWTLMSGSSTTNEPANWGTLNVPASTNHPGARAGSMVWTDASGVVYLFAGQTSDSNGAFFNDLWKFEPDAGCGPCLATAVHEPNGNGTDVNIRWNSATQALELMGSDMAQFRVLSVVNAAGQLIREEKVNEGRAQFRCAGLPTGFYVARLSNGTQQFMQRFIIPD